ncbi:MAG: M20/M25/M40 family metallo-hydrolase [Solirubrobacterales bacterium]|nr:M20/M25/M40 family metallo-hydrolase [Solirubrobacterales bacterium]
MTGVADPAIRDAAWEIAARAPEELAALVDISSPSGDVPGAEAALALCVSLLPPGAEIERPTCSTAGSAPDLVATVTGTGARRALLVGHVDTVIGHDAHQPLRRDGERLYGTGATDMKGGDILALGVARALAEDPSSFAELAILLVTDEEWRVSPFVHAPRFAGYDACLCFEAGQLTPDGEEGVVVTRKAAGTLRVVAEGRAAHSGSAPDRGRNALLALARTAQAIARLHDPGGVDQLSAVPTVMRSGDAFNVVPANGELIVDLRARRLAAFDPVLAAIEPASEEVMLRPRMERRWPAMDSRAATADLLARASRLTGRPVVGIARGGASDASHFADTIALTVDGLGPRGGGAHTPEEFVLADALRERAEIALAVTRAALSISESPAG